MTTDPLNLTPWSGSHPLDLVVYLVSGFMFIYVVVLQTLYTWLAVVGAKHLRQYAKRYPLRNYDYVAESPFSVPVTIIAPAYNEEPGIVESVRSLLRNHYQHIEVVVVNDGSTDDTLSKLEDAFRIQPVVRTPRSSISTQPVRGVYMSLDDPRLIVVDKDNGGKADALNTGINYARYPLVCSIDADSIIDPQAFEKLVWEFQINPDTVATGGTVRIANGCLIEDGVVKEVRAPRKLLPAIQVAEYLRAFLGGRLGWSQQNALIIISGAFGLFRREALVAVNGYDPNTVGEDAEIVLRLIKHHADQGRPFRAAFYPDPVCWTEAPETWSMLGRQRDRWQRGLYELLTKHKDMLFNRRYGKLGTVALPYFWVFELIGPVIEVIGYTFIPLAVVFGLLNINFAILMFVLSILYGVLLSLIALTMQEQVPGRYRRWSDLRVLLIAVLLENFGFRQWHAFVRFKALVSLLNRNKDKGWGEMPRVGIGNSL